MIHDSTTSLKILENSLLNHELIYLSIFAEPKYLQVTMLETVVDARNHFFPEWLLTMYWKGKDLTM